MAPLIQPDKSGQAFGQNPDTRNTDKANLPLPPKGGEGLAASFVRPFVRGGMTERKSLPMNRGPAIVSLCQLAGHWAGVVPEGGLMAERKWDGFRCLWFRGLDGQPRLWTRNGMPIEGCDHIAHRLSLFEQVAGQPLFVDGELVVDGSLAATKAWVEKGWRKGGDAGIFQAFDVLAYSDWRKGGSDMPLFERKARLQRLASAVSDDPALSWEWRPASRGREEWACPVRVVEDEWIFDAAGALDFANRVWAMSGEGAMLKLADEPYRRTRNSAWQKLKPGGPWRRSMRAEGLVD